MTRRIAFLVALLVGLSAPQPRAEGLPYIELSVTDVSQTETLTRNSRGAMVCNRSTTDQFWVRVFTGGETVYAATTAEPSAPVPVASGLQPSCISIPWDRDTHSGAGWKYITFIAAAGKTPSGGIYY